MSFPLAEKGTLRSRDQSSSPSDWSIYRVRTARLARPGLVSPWTNCACRARKGGSHLG